MGYQLTNDQWLDVEIGGSGSGEVNASVGHGGGYLIYTGPQNNYTTGEFITGSGNATLAGDDGGFGAVARTVFEVIFMCTVMLAAIVGNTLVILSVFKFPKLQITANSFIVSLAFADLLVACLVMPFNASQIITGDWRFGSLVCDLFNANDVLFSTASLLHLCCISMDRYIAITDPFHYEQKMTKKKVVLMLMTAWGASASISHIPIHAGWYTTEEQHVALEVEDKCTFRVNKAYAIISSTTSFWIPTVIMVFVYAKIFREANKQAKAIEKLTRICGSSMEHLNKVHINGTANDNHSPTRTLDNSLPHDRKKMKREHKAAKTLGIIMGVFLFCWLPFFLWYMTQNLCGDACDTPDIVVDILFWIGYINSAVNPLIYAAFNQDFKTAFNRLLRLDRCSTMYAKCRNLNNTGYGTEMYHRSPTHV